MPRQVGENSQQPVESVQGWQLKEVGRQKSALEMGTVLLGLDARAGPPGALVPECLFSSVPGKIKTNLMRAVTSPGKL